MKNKKQITIIIPIYNCKNYLAECFDSIVNQTIGLDKLDVIIVDDGSTDGSDEVIKEYKKQYPDWKVISQKNAGLAAARNAALGHLETEYVCFFDSDDILPKTALSDLLKSAEKNKSDIVIGGMGNFTSAGHRPNYTTKYLKHFNQISYKKYIHLLDFVHACGKLYRVSIIKNKRFIAGTKHEDNYFTLSLYLSTDKISMVNKTVYRRRDREGNDKSIMQSLDFNSFKDLLTNYDKALNENDYDEKVLKFLTRKICHYIFKNLSKKDWRKAFALAKDFRNKHKNGKIDFVITWVDGNDPEWLKERKKYEKHTDSTDDNTAARYRDFNLLKYWFRAVETNAPWVHKIYFVTWGHIPKWLNVNNEKLVIVKHSDFIPKQYLPTFNSCAIEMNLHRIKGLSENFVYFNDDMYVLNKTKPTDFFKHGLPCDAAIPDAIIPSGKDNFEHVLVNNSIILNKHFSIKKSVKNNPLKWFNLRYGLYSINTLYFLIKRNFSTIRPAHIPYSLTKRWFNRLWKDEKLAMEDTCAQRFRNIIGVNPWLVQNLQIASGEFFPRNPKIGRFVSVKNDTQEMSNLIKKSKCKLICFNDSSTISNIEAIKKDITHAFEKKYPNNSSFER